MAISRPSGARRFRGTYTLVAPERSGKNSTLFTTRGIPSPPAAAAAFVRNPATRQIGIWVCFNCGWNLILHQREVRPAARKNKASPRASPGWLMLREAALGTVLMTGPLSDWLPLGCSHHDMAMPGPSETKIQFRVGCQPAASSAATLFVCTPTNGLEGRDVILYRQPAATWDYAAEQRSREAASMGLWIHRYLTNRERPSWSRGEQNVNFDYCFAIATYLVQSSSDCMQGGYGHTDGEMVERAWAEGNQLRPGRRHDTLDYVVRAKL
ncbi:hypothetical protein B0H11DRAFT_1912604 [Mycena galericulata]|nr:hypothetical protein B0H11DRAFT_1912604 [Mycena galericulata]